MKVILILLLCSVFVSAQTDWKRWKKKEQDYLLYENKNDDTTKYSKTLVDYTQNFYQFFISDLDGDNCAFYPSCSKFFVSGVKKTNIFKGTLMFADRFTRDINLFKGLSGYSYYYNGKFYDPVENYTLDFYKITFSKLYQPSN